MSERNPKLPEGIVDHIVLTEHIAGRVYSSVTHFDDIVEPVEFSLAVLRPFTRYKMWKLDQQTAKVKELRELLRGIEWIWGSFYGDADCVRCQACNAKYEQRDASNAKHKPDCKLKAEIDQLEPEEA